MEGESATAGRGGLDALLSPAPAERCHASCQIVAVCEGYPLSGCDGPTSCDGFPARTWREDVANDFFFCQAQCPKDPETCAKKAFATAKKPRAIDTKYAAACALKESACNGSFKNDTCGEETLYLESIVEAALACLDRPCEIVADCVDAAFQ
jgi:hypothetical protein